MTDKEIHIDLAELTDEVIAQAKGDNKNVVVTIGYLGIRTAILNPASAAIVLERYRQANGHAPSDDMDVCVIGFDDILGTYDLSAVERICP